MAKNEAGEKTEAAEIVRLCRLSGISLYRGAGRLHVSVAPWSRFTCAQLRPFLKQHARALLPLLDRPPCARCENLRLTADSDGAPRWVCSLNLTASHGLNDLGHMRATPNCAAQRGYRHLRKDEAA